MAKSKTPAKKSKDSLNDKSEKLKSHKAAKKPGKKKETVEPLSNFQTPMTGRENGNEKAPKKEKPPKVAKAVTKRTAISKVKMNKKYELTITSTKIESDGSTTLDSQTHEGRTAHIDLRAVFDKMRVHLGLLCDYLSTQQIKDIAGYDPEKVERFVVRGISISDKNGEGYVISGFKLRKDGKAVILNTPLTMVEEHEDSAYRYMDDLGSTVEELLAEVKQYQDGTKVGDAIQTELPFADADELDDEKEPSETMTEETE